MAQPSRRLGSHLASSGIRLRAHPSFRTAPSARRPEGRRLVARGARSSRPRTRVIGVAASGCDFACRQAGSRRSRRCMEDNPPALVGLDFPQSRRRNCDEIRFDRLEDLNNGRPPLKALRPASSVDWARDRYILNNRYVGRILPRGRDEYAAGHPCFRGDLDRACRRCRGNATAKAPGWPAEAPLAATHGRDAPPANPFALSRESPPRRSGARRGRRCVKIRPPRKGKYCQHPYVPPPC